MPPIQLPVALASDAETPTRLAELSPEQAYEGLLFAFANGWRPGPAAETFSDEEAPTARIATGFIAALPVQS